MLIQFYQFHWSIKLCIRNHNIQLWNTVHICTTHTYLFSHLLMVGFLVSSASSKTWRCIWYNYVCYSLKNDNLVSDYCCRITRYTNNIFKWTTSVKFDGWHCEMSGYISSTISQRNHGVYVKENQHQPGPLHSFSHLVWNKWVFE